MSNYSIKPRVKLTVGWALAANLIESPYQNFYPDDEPSLCAQFLRMEFEDGVPVRPSTAFAPAMIALTEEELRDTSSTGWATVMNVPPALRQEAFEKFPPLSHPEPAPSHVVEPVESAQVVVIYAQPQRQTATTAQPSAVVARQLQMNG